ncbi:MAG: ParB N-terminal domain-containing protein [Campylobacterota bacterium]|nr:ParB N-terminal domain-containing protein [Campylobacterota bacterium]
MQTEIVKTEKIKIGVRLLERENKDIGFIAESIKDNGLINPIAIDAEYNLISGYLRLEAFKSLGYQTIPCVVYSSCDEDKKLLLQIDENLARKDISPFQKGNLLSERKKIYEILFPDSVKAVKSANNAKKKEDRKDLPLVFNDYIAKEMNCDPKTVDNYIKRYEKVVGMDKAVADNLITYENRTKRNFKGVEIDKIIEMSIEEIQSMSEKLEEAVHNNIKIEVKDLIGDTKKKDNTDLIFKLELLEIVSKSVQFNGLKHKIQIDTTKAKEAKKHSKKSYKKQIQYLLGLISDSTQLGANSANNIPPLNI